MIQGGMIQVRWSAISHPVVFLRLPWGSQWLQVYARWATRATGQRGWARWTGDCRLTTDPLNLNDQYP